MGTPAVHNPASMLNVPDPHMGSTKVCPGFHPAKPSKPAVKTSLSGARARGAL